MSKNILVTTFHPGTRQLFRLWQELEKRGYKISFLPSRGSVDYGHAGETRSPSAPKAFFFIIFLPLLYVPAFIVLSFYKFIKKTDALVCSSAWVKLVAAPAARMLKIDNVWLEYPDAGCRPQSRPLSFLYLRHARRARLAAFSGATGRELTASGVEAEALININPGIKTDTFIRQDNIFNRLARSGREKGKNFFTVGTRLSPGCKKNMEILFRAVKKCRGVIADLQLVIIGENNEKKELVWLAKKMEIDAFSWFVGERATISKWLEGMDAYAAVYSRARLEDIMTLLRISAASVPIIAPRCAGLDDFAVNGRNGIVPEVYDSDTLAHALISLRQQPELRARLGAGGKEMVDERFTAKKMADEFENKMLSTKK